MRNKSVKKSMSAMLLLALSAAVLSGCGSKKDASDYFDKGMEYYDSRDWAQAEEYLSKATAMDADNISYVQNYAMTLVQEGRAEEAIEIFKSTMSDKDTNSALKNNKYAYRGIGISYLQMKNYSQAVKCFDLALEIEKIPEWNTDIKYYKANALVLSGEADKALECYNEIIHDDEKNALAYRARADVYRARGDYKKAIDDYNSALNYAEGGFEIYIGLASSYVMSGQQAQADEALFKATLLDIKDDKDKYYLGVVHYYQKKFDSAKAEMEYAIANGIDEAYFYLAEMSLLDDDYKTALECFDKYVQTTVIGSPTVCNDMAVCLIKAGRYDEANEWIGKGLEYTNSSVTKELKRNEIACLEGMGELKKAKEKLDEYLTAYPDDEAAAAEKEYLSTRTR